MSRMNATEQKIQNENLIDLQNANQSYQNTQKDIAQYQGNIGVLSRGGSVGADPYQTPAYLANQNKTIANTTSGQNDAAKQELEMAQRRSGGENTGATQADITKLALGKTRMASQLQSQMKSEDYNKNLQWQQYLAGAPLSAASGQQNLYGTAMSGENSTAGDMSQYALAQYAQSNVMGNDLMKLATTPPPIPGA